jgi:hypothetical protein
VKAYLGHVRDLDLRQEFTARVDELARCLSESDGPAGHAESEDPMSSKKPPAKEPSGKKPSTKKPPTKKPPAKKPSAKKPTEP